MLAEEVRSAESIEELELAIITPASDNPRKSLGDIDELAASMVELGMLQPLVVTPRAGKFMVVCGHRRFAAAKKANLATAPTIVREFTEQQRIKAMLIENCQRTDLTPLEEARAYAQLVELGMNQRAIAADVGKTQSHVSKRTALLELPGNVLKALDSGGITIADALELLKLKDSPQRLGSCFSRCGQHWQGITALVQAELREIAQEKKLAAAEEQLRTAGVKILKLRSNGYALDPPTGSIEISAKGGYYELAIDPKTHAKEPCHAAALNSRTGEVVYLCTDRKRHPKLKTGQERSGRAGNPAASAKFRAHEKAMRASRELRRAFVRGLLRGKVANANELIVEAFIERSEAEARKVACQLLELEQHEVKERYGPRTDHTAPLRELAAKNAAGTQQVGVALALAHAEIRARTSWSHWGDIEKRYLALLKEHGYTVSAAEKLELARKAPRPS